MSEVKTRFLEGADNEFQILRSQDVEPILEYAKGMHNIEAGNGKDDKYAAEIPFVVVENYCNRLGITYQQFSEDSSHIRAICNDPSLENFRIWKGRI